MRPAEIVDSLRLRTLVPLFFVALFTWLILNETAVSEEPDGNDATDVEAAATVNEEEAAVSAEEDEEDPERPLMSWFGESPHWVPGQEFSAVQGAPFIGSQECTYCHAALKTDFLHTAHARTLLSDKLPLDSQGCEMCHGAGGAHAVLRSRGTIFAFDWQDSQHADNICLRCHSWLTSDHEWDRTAHSQAGVSCVQCHNPHQAHDPDNERFLLVNQQDQLCASCHRDAANEFARFSHHPVRLGKGQEPGASAMHCTSCHDVHSGTERAMLPTRRVSDTCAKCHADKAGPFLFEHMGAQEGISDGCLTCHAQHGSHSPTLLVADGRGLCMQCHSDQTSHNASMTCWTSGCHSDVHGSNHSLLLFGEAQ